MREILLVRHVGATGQEVNAPLTAEGKREARVLGGLLLHHRVQRVVSSPFGRAVHPNVAGNGRVGV